MAGVPLSDIVPSKKMVAGVGYIPNVDILFFVVVAVFVVISLSTQILMELYIDFHHFHDVYSK